jgi:hypothetical protein
MRNLYCSCGTLVATLETGSTIKRGTILICRNCANPKPKPKPEKNADCIYDESEFAKSIFGDGDVLDNLRSMFGMKK